jgi:hypothetical protein
MHDPQPLVDAVGYSSFARKLAQLAGSRVEIITHSSAAASVVRVDTPKLGHQTVAHPILEPTDRGFARQGLPIVQVFGQFKPDRDTEALAEIARSLHGRALFRIDGRGWPEVVGWTVSSRFVPESEIDALIADSTVLVIPYRRFFQSGVAIRALEQGVSIVGPRNSSLSDLLGKESACLTDVGVQDSWSTAVASAIDSRDKVENTMGRDWHSRAVREWRVWLDA